LSVNLAFISFHMILLGVYPHAFDKKDAVSHAIFGTSATAHPTTSIIHQPTFSINHSLISVFFIGSVLFGFGSSGIVTQISRSQFKIVSFLSSGISAKSSAVSQSLFIDSL